MTELAYIGNELELFEKAHNWKAYYRKLLKLYLTGDVLEAGAGIGGSTKSLCDGTQRSWVCLEPDVALAQNIERMLANRELPACCSVVTGTIVDLPVEKKFDAIMYIDVIEHIDDDAAELQRAADRLKPGGALIVLVPAHQWLYSPFDKAIGHYRRYNKKRLLQALPHNVKLKHLRYMDSVGLCASSANKLFLKQSYPTPKQIQFWDNVIVPLSKIVDPMTGYMLGKSLVMVATKP
jgi:SAM-dependent methyltransferase